MNGARRFAACALALLLSGTAEAGVRRMVLPVRGMSCFLCTRGVEESIRHLDGVESASADLSSARVWVEAAPGRSLDVQQVRERVVRAGFRIGGEADLLAQGRFMIGPAGRLAFRVQGSSSAYRVLEGSELLRLFKIDPRLQGEFLVGFRLHDHPRWKRPAIAIRSVERVSAPASAGPRR